MVAIKDASLLDTQNQGYPYSEISLRDIFAAFAMGGMLGNESALEVKRSEVAKAAYLLADKMLEERVK